jgi:hypothetical protein
MGANTPGRAKPVRSPLALVCFLFVKLPELLSYMVYVPVRPDDAVQVARSLVALHTVWPYAIALRFVPCDASGEVAVFSSASTMPLKSLI